MKEIIEKAWEDRSLLKNEETVNAIEAVIEGLDKGDLRVAEPINGGWQVNEWIKKAVVMYFPIRKMETIEVGPFEFHDKMALKSEEHTSELQSRPHLVCRLLLEKKKKNKKQYRYSNK